MSPCLPPPIVALLLSVAALAACDSRSRGETNDQTPAPPADTPAAPVAVEGSETPAPVPAPQPSTTPTADAAAPGDAAARVDERLFGSWIPDSPETVWQEPGEAFVSTMSLTTYIDGDSFETVARCTFGDGTVLEARAESAATVTTTAIRIERTVETIDSDESVETGMMRSCTARVDSGTIHYHIASDFELELHFADGIVAGFVKQ